MHYFLFPSKDATIYQDNIQQNTGLDQILELDKTLVHTDGDVPRNSRILMKFDLDTFSSSFASGELSGSDMKYYLNLYTDEAVEIPLSYTIWVYPVSQSWEMGNGKRGDNPVTKTGVSWELRDGVTVSGVTGSAWATTGSDYISGSGYEASQSFSFQTTDLHVDITTMVEAWLDGTLPNYGLIIKRSNTDEQSILNQGLLQFFSNETHTIFRPRIEAVWKDFSYNPYTITSTTYTYTQTSSSVSMSSVEIIGYNTQSFYSGSSVFPTSSYFTMSGDASTWYSESYGYVTASIWSYTGSIGLYHSSSFVTSSVKRIYAFTSGSNTIYSSSILSTITTLSNFYTASLGSEFYPAADANVSYSLSPFTASSIWTYNSAGYYFSSSYVAVTASYTYVSSSLTGYATASSSTTTQQVYPITSEDFVVYLGNLYNEYRQDSKIKFRVKTRERYPRKTFVTASWAYTREEFFLPTQSYYAVKDAWNEIEWMPFSSYTQLSVDASGSYFNLYLNGLEPERLYTIIFKTVQGNVERVFDDDYTFRIIR